VIIGTGLTLSSSANWKLIQNGLDWSQQRKYKGTKAGAASYLKVFQNLNGIMGHTGVILLM
jgi:hypothetical protein